MCWSADATCCGSTQQEEPGKRARMPSSGTCTPNYFSYLVAGMSVRRLYAPGMIAQRWAHLGDRHGCAQALCTWHG